MSWTISKLYRNAQEAVAEVPKESLPKAVVDYVVTAAQELGRLTANEPEAPAILVHGYGHLCHAGPGGGSYEVTTARLAVLPLRFGQTLTLPLQVV